MTTLRLLLLALLLAAPAVAQDLADRDGVAPVASRAGPVISSVWVNGRAVRQVGLGGVAYLVGSGFETPDGAGRPSPGLVVEIDERPVLVLEGSSEHLGIVVPEDASLLGPNRVRVTRPDGARDETALVVVAEGFTGCLPNGLALTNLLVNGQRARRALPGDTLELGGSGWPADRPDGTHPPGLAVTLGDHGLLLVEARPGRLVVRIPEETPPGASTLAVWVGQGDGRRQIGVPLEVADPIWGAAPAPPAPPVPPPPPAAGPNLEITSFGAVEDAAGARLEARGAAPPELPDGFIVRVDLLREAQLVGSWQAKLRGGAWSASLDPGAQGLEPGRYEVVAVFELWRQSRVAAKRFVSRVPGARLGAFDRLEGRATFVLGRRP